ncbi:MAG TPA: macrolide family glycosyltransferase [Dictyobacter sp.]|jgi:MGT family glycosyltransferase|nr:macrolide family glycosyltransferase [Dictyobacter sp.]
MPRFYSFNLPQYGNVNPTLAIIQGLIERGNEIHYYIADSFRETIEATGAQFRSYGSVFTDISMTMNTQDPKFMASRMERMVEDCRKLIPVALEDARQNPPDALIYGQAALGARIIAHILQVPAILIRPTYASNEHFNMMVEIQKLTINTPVNMADRMRPIIEKLNTQLAELCAEYNVPAISFLEMLTHAEPLTIVTLPRFFQFAGETFDERFHFVGPCVLPRHDATDFPMEQLQSERPTLFISLGTSFNNRPEFYLSCFEAFGQSQWQVVLSIGKTVQLAELGPIPENFIVHSYVPQLEVLKKTDIFITHGGMNSTMEGLTQGIPLIVVPQMGEQALSARRVTELGAGLTLDATTVTSDDLRHALEQVEIDASYRANAKKLQGMIQEAGGYQAAVADIMNYVAQESEVHRASVEI